MYLGDRGQEVEELQQQLINMGLLKVKEGFYGPHTKRAVIRLQEMRGREPTGVYDKALLEPVFNPNSIPVVMSDGGSGSSRPSDLTLIDYSLLPRPRGGGIIKANVPCYVRNLNTGTTVHFEVTPEEIPESLMANFEETSPRGRSSPIYGYESSGPHTVNFNLTLSADYCSSGLVQTINRLKAMVYPEYKPYVKAPSVLVRIGNFLHFKGILTSLEVVWKKPYKEGIYTIADVGFNFNRVEESAKSSSEIEGGG